MSLRQIEALQKVITGQSARTTGHAVFKTNKVPHLKLRELVEEREERS